ncbi:MAG: hypothetical protein LRY73_08030 [Bacillus sp. (in: Bacteria)]|nr:hypothetical protein [Bacillus sp. (in: firmicutes)]
MDKLTLHHIPIREEQENAFQLMVEGCQFVPEKIFTKLPRDETFVPSDLTEINRFYLGQEMVDLGMTAAYYLNIPCFSVHLQRLGKNVFVVSVKKQQGKTVEERYHPSGKNTLKLLGGDLEVMAKKKKSESFVALPQINGNNKQIGTDRALLRKGNQFFQPIIELRAKPQPTGASLQKEFTRLKKRLEEQAAKYDLTIVGGANPIGRFFLGGHIHISNERPSYRKVSLLDSLITLPLSCKFNDENITRRRGYGRLGAVRINPFKGFEYRTLPSWYAFIEGGAPFFSWLETVMFNETIPPLSIPNEALLAYYEGNSQVLVIESLSLLKSAKNYLSPAELERLKNWVHWLEIPCPID